jgi:hypothetical protein
LTHVHLEFFFIALTLHKLIPWKGRRFRGYKFDTPRSVELIGFGISSELSKAEGEWRKLHNEKLRNLCSFPNIIRQIKSRRIRWVGHVARMGEERKVYKVLLGEPEGRRPLLRPRHRWEDGIRMNLREIG